MSTRSIRKQGSEGPGFLLGLTVVAGIVSGAAVSAAAFMLARYGPTGGNWSFRGNGALTAYALLPAFLAGGWTAIVLVHRGRPWAAWSIAAGLVGLGLAEIDAILLPAFGRAADQSFGALLLVALLVWAFVAPVVSTRLQSGRAEPVGLGVSLGGALLWFVSLLVGVAAVGFVSPAGS